jgi:hypothetical protein
MNATNESSLEPERSRQEQHPTFRNEGIYDSASIGLIGFISFFVACTSTPNYRTFTLPSGKAIRIMSMMQVNFSQSAPALMLRYETDLKVSDKTALRAEVNEIWPVFRNDVERAKLANGRN